MAWYNPLVSFFSFRRVENPLASVPVDNKVSPAAPIDDGKVIVGPDAEAGDGLKHVTVFDNARTEWCGDLKGFDYNAILRDKQNHIYDLYKLADYFADADPLVHGIIYHVFVPYTSTSKWNLLNAKDKTVKLYEKYYKKIRLREKISDIMLQLTKYNNCFVYLLNGNIITLPPHKVKILNTTLDGQPICAFDCESILTQWKHNGFTIKENWIIENRLEHIFKGFPPEVFDALNSGAQYAQLNPENVFALQGPKEGWTRYAIPFIAAALPGLARKALIEDYEVAMLNIGSRSFVHVRYGDEKAGQDMLPDRNQLTAIRNIFKQAMSGNPLAVTNQLAKAEVITTDMSDLYQWPMYSTVNQEILSAGGISGIIVSGQSDEGSTFSTAQVSMQTAEARINAMREEFEDMMNRINERLVEYIDGTYNLKEPPEFKFEPLEMSGKKALREACLALWEKGCVSTKTMMDTHGYSVDIETARRKEEASAGVDETLLDRATQHADKVMKEQQAHADKVAKQNMKMQQQQQQTTTESKSSSGAGRPKMDDSERKSDPASSDRGSRPKPSNPSGSGDNKT